MAFEFSPNELHRLNRLVFRMRASPTETSSGERRLKRSGDGYDFLDYRPYAHGDDVRKIDWNLYGRFQQLFVRIHESPRQASLTFIVDTSRSMGFGQPRDKLTQGQLIACGLLFVALRGGDRVYVARAGSTTSLLGPISGLRAHRKLVNELQKFSASGKTSLLDSVRKAASRRLLRGLTILISDFLGVGDIETTLRLISAAGGKALGIQILAPEDLASALQPGVVCLQDSETGEMVRVHIDHESLRVFREQFQARQEGLRLQFSRRGFQFLQVSSMDDYLAVISRALSEGTIHR